MTPKAANSPTTVHVTFPNPFDRVPKVVVNAITTVPGTISLGCAAANATTTGFDIIYTRAEVNKTYIDWIAIAK